MLVIDIGGGVLQLANPEIVNVKGEKRVLEEGCLSLPGLTFNLLIVA